MRDVIVSPAYWASYPIWFPISKMILSSLKKRHRRIVVGSSNLSRHSVPRSITPYADSSGGVNWATVVRYSKNIGF